MKVKPASFAPSAVRVRERAVTVMARVKVNGKWRRYEVLYNPTNGSIRSGVVLIEGSERAFASCPYELRYYLGGKKKYKSVGFDATEAENQRILLSNELAMKEMGKSTGIVVLPPSSKRITLVESANDYIEDRELQNKNEAAQDGRRVSTAFIKVCRLTYLDQVDRKSILRFDKALRDCGRADRTVSERHATLIRWLEFAGLDAKKCNFPPTPKYELKLPTVYRSAQLKGLFAAANPYETIACQILLKLGLRDRELQFADFSDISFDAKVFRVRGKPQFGFKIKDHEQREIPIPDDLLSLLREWRDKHPGQKLILANANDTPDTDLCMKVKALAKRARLACGSCKGCLGRWGCGEFNLQKFRRTYITALVQSGKVDINTAAKYAGHADVKTTMRYLRPASAESAQEAVNSIDWNCPNLGL